MKTKTFIAHKWVSEHKQILMFLLVAAVCCFATFAADTGAANNSSDEFGLGKNVKLILQMLGSPWVKGIACIFLIAEAIGLITAGRQEPGMFKKFIPWIAGTVIFMAASTITSKFVNTSKDMFSSAVSYYQIDSQQKLSVSESLLDNAALLKDA